MAAWHPHVQAAPIPTRLCSGRPPLSVRGQGCLELSASPRPRHWVHSMKVSDRETSINSTVLMLLFNLLFFIPWITRPLAIVIITILATCGSSSWTSRVLPGLRSSWASAPSPAWPRRAHSRSRVRREGGERRGGGWFSEGKWARRASCRRTILTAAIAALGSSDLLPVAIGPSAALSHRALTVRTIYYYYYYYYSYYSYYYFYYYHHHQHYFYFY